MLPLVSSTKSYAPWPLQDFSEALYEKNPGFNKDLTSTGKNLTNPISLLKSSEVTLKL